MKKTLSIVLICGLLITIGGVSVFATDQFETGTTVFQYKQIPLSDNSQGLRLGVGITPLEPHIVDMDIEFSQSGSYPSYTIYPTDANGSHLTTISSTTSSSTGGSINLNSPTSTGSQSGRYTIGNLTTTTNLWGFRATPTNASISNTQHSYYCVQYDFVMSVSLYNYNSTSVVGTQYTNFYIAPSFNFSGSPSYLGNTIDIIDQNGIIFAGLSDGYFAFQGDVDHNKSGSCILAPLQTLTSTFMISYFGFFEGSPNVTTPTCGSFIYDNLYITNSRIVNVPVPDSIYHLNNINSNIQSILDQYSANTQNAQALTSGTQTNDQTLSTIHQNEDTWFSQNDQALTATGMEDFNYSPQVMSGLTVISDQFNQLWNAIGQWNFVYTFSMMIGLVVLILRHNPQRKKSSSGGKPNATGS